MIFFFQAEDGIRGADVTGVQTCALPICSHDGAAERGPCGAELTSRGFDLLGCCKPFQVLCRKGFPPASLIPSLYMASTTRSEERRVGKECRSRWTRYQ